MLFLYAQIQVSWLSIADGKLTPDIENIKTLADWPHPTSKREVRSITNFYKRFVSGYAKLMSPLHELQRDEVPEATEDFVSQGCWKPEHTKAFEGVLLLPSPLLQRLALPIRSFSMNWKLTQVRWPWVESCLKLTLTRARSQWWSITPEG